MRQLLTGHVVEAEGELVHQGGREGVDVVHRGVECGVQVVDDTELTSTDGRRDYEAKRIPVLVAVANELVLTTNRLAGPLLSVGQYERRRLR